MIGDEHGDATDRKMDQISSGMQVEEVDEENMFSDNNVEYKLGRRIQT